MITIVHTHTHTLETCYKASKLAVRRVLRRCTHNISPIQPRQVLARTLLLLLLLFKRVCRVSWHPTVGIDLKFCRGSPCYLVG